MHRIRVGVVRGGPSDEYDVSMKTGAAVLAALNRERYDPLDIVITRSGEWLFEGKTFFPETLLSHVDVVFNALHGAFGEDGKFQRILERYGVPYTGSGAYSSAIAMNKVFTKDHLREHDVKMAPHIVVTEESKGNLHNMSESISEMFGPQYIIKPLSSGSSVGTMMVKNPAMLPQALEDALRVNDQVLVEKRIIGREGTVGVIDRFRGEDTYVLPSVEIIPPVKSDFFSADVKYSGETKEICPGTFTKKEKEELSRLARLVHTKLGLAQYSRSDFIVADDGIYFLEVNTLPGLTNESLFPKAMNAVGSSFADLVEHLLTDAREYRRR